jgi:hypothetical protein
LRPKKAGGNGSGAPLPDTIGFYAAVNGQYTDFFLKLGAGARETFDLPRSAA